MAVYLVIKRDLNVFDVASGIRAHMDEEGPWSNTAES